MMIIALKTRKLLIQIALPVVHKFFFRGIYMERLFSPFPDLR